MIKLLYFVIFLAKNIEIENPKNIKMENRKRSGSRTKYAVPAKKMILKTKAPETSLTSPFSFNIKIKNGTKKKNAKNQKLNGRKANIPKNADIIGRSIDVII